MKSLISRIITQSGIEPSAWLYFHSRAAQQLVSTIVEPDDFDMRKSFPDDVIWNKPLYTESQVYEIAENVAKAWAAEKAMDKVIAIGQEIGGYENE